MAHRPAATLSNVKGKRDAPSLPANVTCLHSTQTNRSEPTMCVSGMPGAQSCKCSCEVTFSQSGKSKRAWSAATTHVGGRCAVAAGAAAGVRLGCCARAGRSASMPAIATALQTAAGFISMRNLRRFLLRASGRDARALVRCLWMAFGGANSRRRQGDLLWFLHSY